SGAGRRLAAPPGGQLHEQIVRMLSVDQQGAAVGLAALEQIRRAEGLYGHRLGGESAEEFQCSPTRGPSRGHHQMILRLKVLLAGVAALPVGVEEGVAMENGRP